MSTPVPFPAINAAVEKSFCPLVTTPPGRQIDAIDGVSGKGGGVDRPQIGDGPGISGCAKDGGGAIGSGDERTRRHGRRVLCHRIAEHDAVVGPEKTTPIAFPPYLSPGPAKAFS